MVLEDGVQSIVQCEIQLRNNDRLTVGLFYRSPNSTEQQNDLFYETFEKMSQVKSSHILIMGDFNYPLVDWQHEIPVMESDGTDRFLELFHQSYLYQHVTFPTRYRNDQAANILDLVMTNEESMISDRSRINGDCLTSTGSPEMLGLQ